MERKTKLYCLKDKDGQIRYIGQTCRSLEKRLKAHITDAKNLKYNNHRVKWIRKCLKNNYLPSIELIGEVDEHLGDIAEIMLISRGRNIGLNLTNGTRGGDGVVGYKITSEDIRNRKEWDTSFEHRLQMAQKRGGRPFVCLETGKIYHIIADASRELNIKRKNIRRSLNNNYCTASGLTFKYLGDSSPILSEDEKREIISKKMSRKLKGRKGWSKGLHFKMNLTEEQRRKRGRRGPLNYMFGKHLTEEAKKKLSKAHKNKKIPYELVLKSIRNRKIFKQFICIENNKIYNLKVDAARELSISAGSISLCLNGHNKSAGGYHFKYLDKISNESDTKV